MTLVVVVLVPLVVYALKFPSIFCVVPALSSPKDWKSNPPSEELSIFPVFVTVVVVVVFCWALSRPNAFKSKSPVLEEKEFKSTPYWLNSTGLFPVVVVVVVFVSLKYWL